MAIPPPMMDGDPGQAVFDPNTTGSYVPPPLGIPPTPQAGTGGLGGFTPPAAPTSPAAPPAAGPTEPTRVQGPPLQAEPEPAKPTVNTAFKDALMKLLGTQDPTMDDPAIKAQSDAFGVQQQRAKERARSAMAERFAGEGGPGVDSGAFDSEILGLEQRQGEAQGSHDAGILANELQQRRQQLLSAAALAGNQLNEEERLAFQKELAKVDEELQRLRIGQGDRGIALDERRLNEASQQWNQQFGLEGQRLAETIRQFDTTTQMGRDQLKQALDIFKTQMGEQGRQFDVDAELKRLGIQQQGDLGRGDLDLRRFLGEGNLNLGLLSALLQNQQFGQGLGADLGKFNASRNDNFLQALLNALGQAA